MMILLKIDHSQWYDTIHFCLFDCQNIILSKYSLTSKKLLNIISESPVLCFALSEQVPQKKVAGCKTKWREF